MQNKVFQQIVDGLASKYGKDVSRTAFSAYGDDVMKKGAKSFLDKELAGTNTAPKMVSYHTIPHGRIWRRRWRWHSILADGQAGDRSFVISATDGTIRV